MPLYTRNYTGLLLTALLAAATLGGCTDKVVDPPAAQVPEPASFTRMQTDIFAKSCAISGCHTSGAQMAIESGLVLDSAVAYANLVNVAPKNEQALEDGLLRVKPGDADLSLLFHKLDDIDGHHGNRYGNPMPLGGMSLSAGKLEFIRQWIMAGAPDTGVVAVAGLLDDTTAIYEQPFTPLAAPAQGYQLKIEPFDIQPQFERELFVYRLIGNTEDIYVNRIETKMRRGSHHLLLQSFLPGTPGSIKPQPDMIRDIRNPDGTLNEVNMRPMFYHMFFGGSMTQYGDLRLPEGVALQIPANTGLDFNLHYVNKTDQPITGEAYANLYTVDKAQVQHVARAIGMNNDTFTLPPRQRTTVTRTFPVMTTTTFLVLTSHTHKRGEEFVIKISGGARDGEVIYRTTDWEHPLIKVLSEPLVLERGQGLTSVVTYNNETDKAISFGLTSEDEMNFIFGYYY